jgi:hypothetical protein
VRFGRKVGAAALLALGVVVALGLTVGGHAFFGTSAQIPGADLTVTCSGAIAQLNSTAVTDSAATFSPGGVAETTTNTSPVTVAASVDSANPYRLLTFALNVPSTAPAGSYSNSVTLVSLTRALLLQPVTAWT